MMHRDRKNEFFDQDTLIDSSHCPSWRTFGHVMSKANMSGSNAFTEATAPPSPSRPSKHDIYGSGFTPRLSGPRTLTVHPSTLGGPNWWRSTFAQSGVFAQNIIDESQRHIAQTFDYECSGSGFALWTSSGAFFCFVAFTFFGDFALDEIFWYDEFWVLKDKIKTCFCDKRSRSKRRLPHGTLMRWIGNGPARGQEDLSPYPRVRVTDLASMSPRL